MTSRAARCLPVTLALLGLPAFAAALDYPASPRGAVTDTYFGTVVEDPYRWLEDTDAAATREWVEAQNRLSLPLLAGLPERGAIRERLRELWNYERYDLVEKQAGQYFYRRNDGLQNQSVLYVQAPGGAARALLDPNQLSADGTVALTQFRVSPDGRRLAYGIAASGSDWNEFRVRDVATGVDLDERLTRIKFSTIAWTRDSRGFFYSRYPDPPAGAAAGTFDALANQKLWYHRVGTPQSQDVLVHEDATHPKWGWQARVTDDGRYLVLSVWQGSAGENAIHVKDLGDPQAPKLDAPLLPLVPEFKAQYELIGNRGSQFYFRSNEGAARGRVVAVDVAASEPRAWRTVVAEQADTLKHALFAGGQLVVLYLHDATSRLQRYSLDGKPLGAIALPGLGSIPDLSVGGVQISGDLDDAELFYGFASYNRPQTNYVYDLKRGKGRVFQPLKLKFNPADYVTEQVFYRSKDGTRVPMFLSYRKGLKRNGRAPTLLYGYGGFDISQTPNFSVPSLVWMERGGIYAVANLRGGGEYGKAWHEAGTKERKQNVFDDFIAAGEYLVAERWTSPAHLAISGRSNGGLLVGATLNQRPDLFAAALPAVGVLDMLRYHRFTIGWAWAGDYGTSDSEEGFRYLSAYSPVHTVRKGTAYPAVLITTADHDDRVVPGHSFKYAAALQWAQGGDKPVLIRIDVKAGHGAGKPIAMQIEEEADKLAFLEQYTRAK
ncbi:MAG TPA: prolyl oligopeptidase family serine peptidase [Solimonas sp.]|nr:prolyl oligopeptidase family serine peptidase [Solimonas sp.]